MAPKSWYNWLSRQLAKYNLTVNDFKENPYQAYIKSPEIRAWMNKTFTEQYNKKLPVKWFNKILNFHDIFTDEEWNLAGNTSTIPKEDIEDIAEEGDPLPDNAQELTPSKRQKTTHEPQAGPSRSNKPNTSKTTTKHTASTATDTTPQKKQRINPTNTLKPKTATKQGPSPDQTAQVKKTLGFQETDSTTTEAQPVTGSSEQQVDTPAGPDHNTKGTLQGESGNRKIQKPQIRYGVIQVNIDMSEQSYIFLFEEKDQADNCCDVFEMHWSNCKILCTTINIEKHSDKTYCLVVIQLGFKINWSTLLDKIGSKIIKDIYYFQRQVIREDFSNSEIFLDIVKKNLNVCFRNNVVSLDIIKEAEKELAFRAKQVTSSEPTPKRARWIN